MKPTYYHRDCLWDEPREDERYIDDDNLDCDDGGWEQVCEHCDLPSAAAQRADAERLACWAAYFSGGMLEATQEGYAALDASRADLEAESRLCGRPVRRP